MSDLSFYIRNYKKIVVLSYLSGLVLDDCSKCYVLAFMRQIKEKHLIKDFKTIWGICYHDVLTSLKDIYKKGDEGTVTNPYRFGFSMMVYGVWLHKNSQFYYIKEAELEEYIKRYRQINGF